MTGTPRLNLPFLSPGQAQKEFFHNEALQTLDAVVAASVEEPPRAAPPTTPAIGACYVVGAGATGAWVGKDGHLAAYTSGGWRFVPPQDGLTAHVRSTGTSALYRAGAWELGNIRGSSLTIEGQQVVGGRRPAIASPAGGSTVDAQARTAIDEVLGALRQHGLIAT